MPKKAEKSKVKQEWSEAKNDYKDIGGWKSMKSGEWLWRIIQKSFANYWERANVEYFQNKYHTKDIEKISKKLISVTARNASILGGIVGAAVTADEIVALTSGGEGGIGLPANIAIAATAISGEAILLIRFQLQLVANLGKLYGVPLDPNDPEDILTIFAFAVGGSAADVAGKFGMKVGGKIAGRVAKNVFKKETLAALKRIATKIGIKILQRTIVKYTIPVVSIMIGTIWNYVATKTVARIAIKHFKVRKQELGS